MDAFTRIPASERRLACLTVADAKRLQAASVDSRTHYDQRKRSGCVVRHDKSRIRRESRGFYIIQAPGHDRAQIGKLCLGCRERGYCIVSEKLCPSHPGFLSREAGAWPIPGSKMDL